MVNIVNCNVNGLRQKLRRHTILKEIKGMEADICTLQETFITDNNYQEFKKGWDGDIIYSAGTNHSLGNVILFKKEFIVENRKIVFKDDRIICLEFLYEKEQYLILCVYFPNDTNGKCQLFKDITNILINQISEATNLLIAGDFNCTLKPILDNISGNLHPLREINTFKQFISDNKLYDLWRMYNEENKEYTWRHKSRPIMRRIDYILTNENMFNKSRYSSISTLPLTDHKCVIGEFQTHDMELGPSFWKFNNSLLSDQNYLDIVNNLTATIEEQNISPHVVWDLFKKQVKDITIEYSRIKAKIHKDKVKDCRQRLLLEQHILTHSPHDETQITKVNTLELEYSLLCINECKGAQIRAKIKWIEDGEKNTKFFLNLEKVRGQQKIMTKLHTDNGIITNQNDIMKEQVKFYAKLYSKSDESLKSGIEEFMNGIDLPKINEHDKYRLDEEITNDKLLKALKTMKNDSSPGCDGLTAAWYKVFWLQIRNIFKQSLIHSFQQGELSNSQRRGIIKLLYKGKGDRHNLGNWRPITLTNIDYKILTKVLANRLKTVIGTIIHEDQNGYIKGRHSGIVIRTLDDIIEYANRKSLKVAILSLDYTKAFDTISREYMLKSLEVFNFGEIFSKWLNIIFSKTVSCISYCGWQSGWFNVLRGIWQGCPLSPLIFITAIEILAAEIRQTKNITGIKIPSTGVEIKIMQYADDSTLICNSEDSIINALKTVEIFSVYSGLKLNRYKTEAIWTGCWKYKKKEIGDIQWRIYPNNKLKILGIYIKGDAMIHEIPENIEFKIEKCLNLIKTSVIYP